MKYRHLLITAGLSLLALFVCLPAKAQGIQFFNGSFQEAVQEAKKQNKKLFIDFFAVWCGPCKMMEKKVFTQPAVGEYFNARFISVQLDAEKPENADVVKKFNVGAFPTLAFFDQNGELISLNTGACSAEELVERAKVVTGEAKGFLDYYKEYEKDNSNMEVLQQLLQQAQAYMATLEGIEAEKWHVRIRKAYANYLDTKGVPALINKDDYILLTVFDGLDEETDKKAVALVADNLENWKKELGDTPAYFVIEHNDAEAEALAKAGKEQYKECLEKIRGKYANAYSVVAYKNVSPYDRSKLYYDALYGVYKQKDAAGYIQKITQYFQALGEDLQPTNYAKAAQDLYYAVGKKLTIEQHNQAISWLQEALKGDVSMLDKVNYTVMIGDSYKEMKEYNKAEQYYNQAFALSLSLTELGATQEMIASAIKVKLAELELLR